MKVTTMAVFWQVLDSGTPITKKPMPLSGDSERCGRMSCAITTPVVENAWSVLRKAKNVR